jgi:hypothetical protein
MNHIADYVKLRGIGIDPVPAPSLERFRLKSAGAFGPTTACTNVDQLVAQDGFG